MDLWDLLRCYSQRQYPCRILKSKLVQQSLALNEYKWNTRSSIFIYRRGYNVILHEKLNRKCRMKMLRASLRFREN